MKLDGLWVRNENIAAMQYFMAQKDEKTDTVTRPAYFDVILKSGNVLHVQDDTGDLFTKAIEQLGIE